MTKEYDLSKLDSKELAFIYCLVVDEWDCYLNEASEFFPDYWEVLKLRIQNGTACTFEKQIYNRIKETASN